MFGENRLCQFENDKLAGSLHLAQIHQVKIIILIAPAVLTFGAIGQQIHITSD